MIRKIIIAIIFLLYYGYVESGKNPLTVQGGGDSNITTNNFVAYIYNNISKGYYFGGSIISPRFIVTAGNRIFEIYAPNFLVRVGSLSSTEKTYRVRKSFIPDDYSSKPNENDIGLLQLQDKLNFGTGLGAIKLARNFIFTVNTTVQALGFGDIGSGSPAQKLQEANFTIIANQRCGASTSQFCIKNEVENEDIKLRLGDEGDPIIYDGKLIGIVCWTDFRSGISFILRVPEKLAYIEEIAKITP